MNKKHQMLYFLLIALMLSLIISCQKETIEQSAIELTVEGKQKVITVENNGIGIEFCLLNENGEPATIFQEGENFKFHLAIVNHVEPDTAMYIVSDFIYNEALFKVLDRTESTIGKPWEKSMCLEISDAANQIYAGEKWIIESPWVETRVFEGTDESDNIKYLQCYFSGLSMKPLPIGKYFTELSQQFCLGKYLPHPHNEFVCTDFFTLRINFEIK
jgi:hypothetical protein